MQLRGDNLERGEVERSGNTRNTFLEELILRERVEVTSLMSVERQRQAGEVISASDALAVSRESACTSLDCPTERILAMSCSTSRSSNSVTKFEKSYVAV